MTPKGHEHLTYHQLGNTKTSILQQKDITKCLVSLLEKLAVIPHPSQHTLLSKTLEISSKCRHENKHRLLHFDPPYPLLKLLHTLSQITPKHTRRPGSTTFLHQTTLPTHRKYHFSALNFYIQLQEPPLSVEIMLAMFSWLLEIRLHTVYLTYPFWAYYHRLQ